MPLKPIPLHERQQPAPGVVFSDLAVLGPGPRNASGAAQWYCRCVCGAETLVPQNNLKRGNTKSCGCRRWRNTGHGLSDAPEYDIWQQMIQRCTNPQHRDYKRYGGRGIRVHAEWLSSVEAFLADVGPRPSPAHALDRYPDKDGNFCPGNVRWATRSEQARRRRNAVVLTFAGQTLPLLEWAERSGISGGTIRRRLRDGWSVAAALGVLANGERSPIYVPRWHPSRSAEVFPAGTGGRSRTFKRTQESIDDKSSED